MNISYGFYHTLGTEFTSFEKYRLKLTINYWTYISYFVKLP